MVGEPSSTPLGQFCFYGCLGLSWGLCPRLTIPLCLDVKYPCVGGIHTSTCPFTWRVLIESLPLVGHDGIPERLHMCAFGHVPDSLELATESALWPESLLARSI